jgi:hypothetical protein
MSESPTIDLSGLDFPSDHLTVKALREAHRDQFDQDFNPTYFRQRWSPDSGERTVGLMLYLERVLAASAFNQAVGGQNEVVTGFDRNTFVEELTAFYVRYGLATGGHHAEQLIRGMESEAAAQARGKAGRRP